MSLEHALLNRLEARSVQLAQMKKEIHGLKQLVDEKMTSNEQLAEQITTARLDREQMQHQISELRTECDRIREISKSLVPKSALKQAVMEAAGLSSEVAKLRAEVPLESTREALKNAAAKLQEVTTDRDRVLNELGAILAEANKSGRCNGDPVALIKQGQNDLDALRSLEREYAESDKLIDRLQQELSAAQEDRNQAGADAATARADAQRLGDECARLAGKVAELEAQKTQAERMERGIEVYSSLANDRAREIEALRQDVARERDRGNRINAEYEADMKKIMATANELGRADYEAPDAFMKRQAVRLAALESQAGKIGYVAKGEHEEAVTAARENGIHKGESLSGFIWRQCESLRKSQAENAPLNKVFIAICKQRGNLNEEIIYRAVDEASDAIKKLTA